MSPPVQPDLLSRKADRWDELRSQGLDPGAATAQVEQEFDPNSPLHAARRAMGAQPPDESDRSLWESVQGGAKGLLEAGWGAIKGLPTFAQHIGRALSQVDPGGAPRPMPGTTPEERIAATEPVLRDVASPVTGYLAMVKQAHDPLAPPVTPEQAAAATAPLAATMVGAASPFVNGAAPVAEGAAPVTEPLPEAPEVPPAAAVRATELPPEAGVPLPQGPLQEAAALARQRAAAIRVSPPGGVPPVEENLPPAVAPEKPTAPSAEPPPPLPESNAAPRIVAPQPSVKPVASGPTDLPRTVNPDDYLNIDRLAKPTPESGLAPQSPPPVAPELRGPIERAVQRTVDQIYPQGRPVEGFPQVLADAQRLAADPAALDRVPVSRMSGAERLAHRILYNVDTERYVDLAKQASDPTLPETQRAGVEAELQRVTDALDARLPKILKGGTQQGRDLAANRILAGQTLDPSVWHERAMRLLGDQYDRLPDAVRDRINGLLDAKNTEELSRYVASLRQRTFAQKVARFYKTNLVSSFRTPIKVLTGTQADLWMFRAGPTRAMEILADRLIAPEVRVRTGLGSSRLDVARSAAKAIPAEMGKLARGEPVPGGGRGTGFLEQGAFTNAPPEVPAGTLGRLRYGALKVLDDYENVIGRREGLAHRLGWQPAYQFDLFQQARLRATAEAQAAGHALAEPALRARAAELAANPSDEMQAHAIEAADRATYLNQNVASDALGQLKRTLATAQQKGALTGQSNLGARAGYFATEMAAPFVKITTNVAARGLETTPVGLAPTAVSAYRLMRAVTQDLPPAVQAALKDQFLARASRAAVGTGLAWLGVHLVRHGLATGGPVSAPRARAMREYQDAGDFQVKVGGHWYSVLNFGPLGFGMAMGTGMGDAFTHNEHPGLAEKISSALATVPAVISGESFMRGTQQAAEASTDPLGAGARWAERVAGGFVPASGLLGTAAEAADSLQRRPRTVADYLQSRVPGLREWTPPRLNPWGEPMPDQRSPLDVLLNPLGARRDPTEDDPTLKEVVRVQALMPETKPLPTEGEQTYLDRARIRGHAVRQAVTLEMGSPAYQAAGTRAQILMNQDPELAHADPETITLLIQRQMLENAAHAALAQPWVKDQERILEGGAAARANWRTELRRAAAH